MIINGLVLAAGMSTRMGQFKPLLKIGKKTMVEQTVDKMLAAGVKTVVVVLGCRGKEIEERLLLDSRRGEHLCFAYNKAYETTQMLDSIKIGLKVMPDCDFFFLSPGDMPAISVATYKKLWQQAENNDNAVWEKIYFPTMEGHRKHPPLLHSSLKEEILGFEGEGLRALWSLHKKDICEVPIEDIGCTLDADYPEEFQRICTYMANEEHRKLSSRYS